MGNAHTTTEITITTDPKFAQTILATFDNYEAARTHFDNQLDKLSANRGGLVSMTEGPDTFSITVDEDGGHYALR